ncbi:MAG: hypothetical protein KME17_11650 [Cyanosarcina radialis HA8281-LM2]|jgi:hypothetical protein|nr:hypothetical protein [Cyanosarcina radialis HA8281-LM2]
MAEISITDLQLNNDLPLFNCLETEELELIKIAVERAIDARQVVGGTNQIKLGTPTIGIIFPPPNSTQ